MQIHLVTGKGGVGKSTFALALGKKLARQNKKVLVVELGEESYFSHFLSLPPLTYTPVTCSGGFDIARWDGTSALSEYVRHLLKLDSLHKIFFENQVTRSLVDAAPGLKELAILGKITSGPPRRVGPKMDYDILIVDAFASGHFLALLRAPLGMSQTFRRGPMAEQTQAIMQTLNNPQWTHLHIVSLPEELPVVETIESLHELKELIQIKPQIWLNKCWEFPVQSEYELNDIAQEQTHYFQKLNSVCPTYKLPYILTNSSDLLTHDMANSIL